MNSNIERNFIESFYSFLDAHAECNLANPTHQEEPSIEIQTEELKERLDNVESKLDDVESLTKDHEVQLDELERQDLDDRLESVEKTTNDMEDYLENLTTDVGFRIFIQSLLEESLEHLYKNRLFKEQIDKAVDGALQGFGADGRIKIYISSGN